MSRARKASVVGGKVLVEGFPVDVAEIFSEGAAPSEGVAILDKDKVFYFAKTSPDLKATLEQVIEALGQAKTALDKTVSSLTTLQSAGAIAPAACESLGASGTSAAYAGASATVAADTAAITAAATAINAAKTALNTLKGALK